MLSSATCDTALRKGPLVAVSAVRPRLPCAGGWPALSLRALKLRYEYPLPNVAYATLRRRSKAVFVRGRLIHVERILVTGGAGYIGSVLVRQLLDEGRHVTVLDPLQFGESPIEELYSHPCFEFVEGDVRDRYIVGMAVEDADAVVHLGAVVGDTACRIDGRVTREINYEATRLLTESCKRAGVERLVYASTCSVYGLGEDVVDETSPLQPLSLYSESKAASERFLRRSADASFQPVILRIGTVFGWSHRPRFDLAVNLLTAQAHFDKCITIYNKQNRRPFVHVRDVVAAFTAALRAPSGDVGAEVFNVGSETMNLQLARLAEIVCNHVPDVLVRHEKNGDARSCRASFEKIRRVLGVKCSTTLDSGISEILTALERGVVEDPLSPIYHNHRLAALPGPELNKQVAALRSVYGGPTVAVAAP